MMESANPKGRIRFPLSVVAAFIGTLALVVGGSMPYVLDHVRSTFSDSDASQYEDVRYVRSRCPSLQPMVDQALSDGKLSKREAIRIGERMAEATDTWDEYRSMAPARRNLGLAVSSPPPTCDNRRPDGDFKMGRILEPLWIR